MNLERNHSEETVVKSTQPGKQRFYTKKSPEIRVDEVASKITRTNILDRNIRDLDHAYFIPRFFNFITSIMKNCVMLNKSRTVPKLDLRQKS